MKIFGKLLVLGGVAAAAILVDRKLIRGGSSGGARDPLGAGATARGMRAGRAPGSTAGIVDAEILVAGISEVDPGGLVGMGEAIDPEANEEAHESVGEQRARMPIRGRDVP